MKTLPCLKSKSIRLSLTLAIALLAAGNAFLFSQEANTVFEDDPGKTGFVWGLELKTVSIQEELGTQYGMYAGTLFNRSLMVGLAGALNVTHPAVNYGCLGMMVQYAYRPLSIFHMSGQLTLGAGTTKDYENEKTSTFDNFGNVTGTGFYFMEPALNGEINLGARTRLVLGIGYRLVYGINPENENVNLTHVTDRDLSGMCVSAGVKFGLY